MTVDMEISKYRDFNIYPEYIGFMFVHEEYTGDEDNRLGHENTIFDCKIQIDAWWDERTILALRGLVGLVEMVSRRDDMPVEIRNVLATNHRIIEAREVIVGQEARKISTEIRNY